MILRLFAAVSFAGLLTLAVATVSLKTSSLRARARIERLALAVKAQRYEFAHRQRELARATTRDQLRQRLRVVLSALGAGEGA
ncbi:MAG: hypothetical protein R3F56_05630 [Planctomycetota bacterium]